MRRRRIATPLGAAAAVLAVAVLAVAGSGGPGVDDANPSSRSPGAGGTLALHEWTAALGLQTDRLTGRFDPGGADVVVVVDPVEAFEPAEVDALLARLDAGAELVLAVGPGSLAAATPLLDRLGEPVTRGLGPGAAGAVQPLEPGDRIHRVAIGGRALDLAGGAGAPLLSLGDGVVMRGLTVGAGRAYVLGSAFPLTNDGLRSSRPAAAGGGRVGTGTDADLLWLSLLAHASPLAQPPLRVAFDEVHHGEGAGSGAAQILVTPLGAAALLAALVVVAWLAGEGRHLGRPVRAGQAGPPAAGDLVRAVAGLTLRSHRRGGIAGRLAAEVKERVGGAVGVDPLLADGPFLAAVHSRTPAAASALAPVLARARALEAGRPRDGELVALAREVADVEARQRAAVSG